MTTRVLQKTKDATRAVVFSAIAAVLVAGPMLTPKSVEAFPIVPAAGAAVPVAKGERKIAKPLARPTNPVCVDYGKKTCWLAGWDGPGMERVGNRVFNFNMVGEDLVGLPNGVQVVAIEKKGVRVKVLERASPDEGNYFDFWWPAFLPFGKPIQHFKMPGTIEAQGVFIVDGRKYVRFIYTDPPKSQADPYAW